MSPLDANPYAAPKALITPVEPTPDGPVPASLGWRFVAFLIDSLICDVLIIMMYGVLYGLTGHALDDTPWQDLGLAAGILLTWTGYFALMESSRWQATLGKRLFRLRVVGPGSGRISFGRAVGRAVLKLLGLGILYLGLIPALFTRQRQTLHDLVTGTVVVRRPPASAVNPDLDMQ